MQTEKFDVVVIGSGVNGLSSCYYLAKKDLRVALLQQYTVGHHNASSHSDTRIYRSAYQKVFYRQFAKLTYNIYWKQLEKQLQCQLITQNPFIYYDETNTYLGLANIVQSDQSSYQMINPSEVVQRYPGMPYINTNAKPIIQYTGGLIYASTYIQKLKQKLISMPNVTIFENTLVKNIRSNKNNVSVETQQENIQTEKVVVACGKWVTKILPEMKEIVRVVKQIIVTITLHHPQKFMLKNYPSWLHKDSEGTYLIEPNLKQNGIKITQRFTSDNVLYQQNTKLRVQRLKKRMLRYFENEVKQIKSIEQCYYTLTKTQDFIVDWIDENERVLVCSACSGHGFKFSPIIGKIVSDLIQEDQSIQIFEKNRYLFRIPYHHGINLQ